MNHEIFEHIKLDEENEIYISRMLNKFNYSYDNFLKLWNLHPEKYHKIKVHGKELLTPRWQQAYGKNYRYSGSKSNALPIPEYLKTFLEWSCLNIDDRLNGVLLNWYDGQKGHYIGAHRDDTRDLIDGSPIVTISLGQERIFRLRPYQQKGFQDIKVRNGEIIIIPFHTNTKWTHEVPKFKKYDGKRISVTLRAFL